MLRLIVALVLFGASAYAVPQAPALGGASAPSAEVQNIGSAILGAVDGRTYEQAFAAYPSFWNPFAIDTATLLSAAGAAALSEDYSTADIGEGELSLLLRSETPGNKFIASEETPAIFAFATKVQGRCLAGYVTGYPVADRILETDLTGRSCHASSVERIVWDQYLAGD